MCESLSSGNNMLKYLQQAIIKRRSVLCSALGKCFVMTKAILVNVSAYNINVFAGWRCKVLTNFNQIVYIKN